MLGRDEQADELLLMGLRLREGVDLARWSEFSAAIWTRIAKRFYWNTALSSGLEIRASAARRRAC